MLQIEVVIAEAYDEATTKFSDAETITLLLEHSLVSLSKWESKWMIPFLNNDKKTFEHILDYVRMMTVSGELSEHVLSKLSEENYKDINAYIDAKMTATTIREKKQGGPSEVVTAELIYYWMIALGVPFECQHWHLNKLLMLIKVCNAKNAPAEKMSSSDTKARQKQLNAQRRREMNSKG